MTKPKPMTLDDLAALIPVLKVDLPDKLRRLGELAAEIARDAEILTGAATPPRNGAHKNGSLNGTTPAGTVADAVRDTLGRSRRVEVKPLADRLERRGFHNPRAAISAYLTGAIKRKEVKRVDRGVYEART